MSGKAVDTGKSFLEGVFAKLSAEQQALLPAEVVEVLAPHVGEGVLRQSEFSSEMDRLSKIERDQIAWKAANEAAIETGRKALAAGFDPSKPDLTSPALPKNVVTEEILEQRERGYAAVTALVNTLSLKHYQEFGEILDTEALMADPNAPKLGLKAAYDARFAEKYAAKAKSAIDADVAKRVEAGIREGLKARSGNPNFPTTEADSSPLAALAPVTGKADVGDLVAEYEALVAAGAPGHSAST